MGRCPPAGQTAFQAFCEAATAAGAWYEGWVSDSTSFAILPTPSVSSFKCTCAASRGGGSHGGRQQRNARRPTEARAASTPVLPLPLPLPPVCVRDAARRTDLPSSAAIATLLFTLSVSSPAMLMCSPNSVPAMACRGHRGGGGGKAA